MWGDELRDLEGEVRELVVRRYTCDPWTPPPPRPPPPPHTDPYLAMPRPSPPWSAPLCPYARVLLLTMLYRILRPCSALF